MERKADALALDLFRDYFREVHGADPYPWQEALLERVLGEGWPKAVALPAGSGKTAALDVALFHAAWDPGAPRRVVYVVNRRLVVDQAEARAQRIVQALEGAKGKGARWLAQSLKRLGGLRVVKLRGGLPLPRRAVEDPAAPTVLLSTIDQVGSRLLFRGYGLSPRDWPVEAGLLGVDTLFLLDEAHLERPFFQLLGRVEEEVRGVKAKLGRPGLQAVALTATPQVLGLGDTLGPTPKDWEHSGLKERWELSKPLELRSVPRKGLVQGLVEAAKELLQKELASVVVVFCNRVDTARKVFQKLGKELQKDKKLKPLADQGLLLTGRIRPFDRDRLLREDLQGRLDGQKVAFVVATQALEVGADLSFRGLVTELAPLDALLQRLGRLGRRGKPGVQAVLVREEGASPHPYPQGALEATWGWLEGKGSSPDLGTKAFQGLGAPPQEAWALGARPPDLPPGLLRLFALTDPPVPRLDPGPLLHGLEGGRAEVGLAFRADLDDLEEILKKEPEALLDLVPPPGAYETVEVPLWVARAFLQGKEGDPSDLEGEGAEQKARGKGAARPALRFRPGEGYERVWPQDLRPGDLLLVPARYGGLDQWGWNPGAKDHVRDVAEARPPGGEPPALLRLHRAVLWDLLSEGGRAALGEDAQEALARPLDPLRRLLGALEEEDPGEAYRAGADLEEALQGLGVDPPPPPKGLEALEGWLGEALLAFLGWLEGHADEEWKPALRAAQEALKGRRYRLHHHQGYPGVLLRLREEVLELGGQAPQGLQEHQEAVRKALRGFLDSLRLPQELEGALEEAALWHDEGKLDPRFQIWLRLTAPEGAELPPSPLAKSGTLMEPWKVDRLRSRAGYPKGQRHELQAAAALKGRLADLAVHLIGTHHGRARPLPAGPKGEKAGSSFHLREGVVAQAEHGLERLSSGWMEGFFRLQEAYTPWGLAYLEALLRLADERASKGV